MPHLLAVLIANDRLVASRLSFQDCRLCERQIEGDLCMCRQAWPSGVFLTEVLPTRRGIAPSLSHTTGRHFCLLCQSSIQNLVLMEATIVCIDNSEWTRNGDYAPSRFQAQSDAVNLLAGAKTEANRENTVGVITMSGKSPRVLVTLTTELGKILNSVQASCLALLIIPAILNGLHLPESQIKRLDD